VTGLRPTFGRVSRTGVMTAGWSMDKVGPICRDVEDCAIVLEAIRGADGIDRAAVDAPFNYTPSLDLRKLRIGYRRSVGGAVLERLAAIVGQEQLVPVSLPTTPIDVFVIMEVELATVFDEMFRLGADNYLLSNSPWRAELPLGRTISGVEYLQANRHRKKLIEDMAQLMDQIDVYVTDFLDIYDSGRGAARALLNMSGHPCVSIPHGGSDTCLAFVGQLYDEATIMALAKAYQDATSYHTGRPPGFVD
jgi:Asp-tRNA(Asn)/Glu-tRNA(Gln) amidotransferase A subunit family amidase